MSSVSVLGDGAWGTALASLLADNGHQVILWCNDHEVAQGFGNFFFENLALYCATGRVYPDESPPRRRGRRDYAEKTESVLRMLSLAM